jgi:hypothetical protein
MNVSYTTVNNHLMRILKSVSTFSVSQQVDSSNSSIGRQFVVCFFDFVLYNFARQLQ